MLRAKLSALLPATLRHPASLRSSRPVPVPAFVACNSPCSAHKAGDLPSWQIPLVARDEPCFAHSRQQANFDNNLNGWIFQGSRLMLKMTGVSTLAGGRPLRLDFADVSGDQSPLAVSLRPNVRCLIR
jgi:hypothetical protein